MVTNEKFYNYIKSRRIRLGLTQTEVAKRLKVAISTVSIVETGQFSRYPSNKVLELARILKEDPTVFATLWIEAAMEEQKEKLTKKIYCKDS